MSSSSEGEIEMCPRYGSVTLLIKQRAPLLSTRISNCLFEINSRINVSNLSNNVSVKVNVQFSNTLKYFQKFDIKYM